MVPEAISITCLHLLTNCVGLHVSSHPYRGRELSFPPVTVINMVNPSESHRIHVPIHPLGRLAKPQPGLARQVLQLMLRLKTGPPTPWNAGELCVGQNDRAFTSNIVKHKLHGHIQRHGHVEHETSFLVER